jgi:uncharacterized membrane protein
MLVLLSFLFILVPVAILFLTHKFSILDKIGAVIIAYALGLILGHIGLIPRPGVFLESAMQSGENITSHLLNAWLLEGSISEKDILAYKVYRLQDLVASIAIPLALPLLLFSLKIKVWFRMSGKTMISMMLAVVSAITVITIGFHLFKGDLESPEKIAGMLVALYTGGTPNLASLKEMLSVDAETYIMTHTYDTVVSVVYLLFLISVGKHLFRFFLPSYPMIKDSQVFESITFKEKPYAGFFLRETLKGLVFAIGVALLIFAISVGVSLLVPSSAMMLVVILSITSLSISASFISRINAIEKSFELGMYFIIVFSFVVATMADIHKLLNISGALFAYISIVVFGALGIHSVLCRIFKVDSDTFMVTSTALVCSPPFVPMVAGALKNKEVVVSGLTVGIMGYAIGNYLGVLLARLL